MAYIKLMSCPNPKLLSVILDDAIMLETATLQKGPWGPKLVTDLRIFSEQNPRPTGETVQVLKPDREITFEIGGHTVVVTMK